MEKRKQASRTPNASRNTTSQSMSERQGVRGLLNLAAAFGVREACFRFGLSQAGMLFGIAGLESWKAVLFQVQCQRSEEHTSELQSPCNLVCRLLLEKKKQI